MVDMTAENEDGQPDDGAGVAIKRRRFSGKKIVLFGALPLVLLIIGGLAAWKLGVLEHAFHGEADTPKAVVFYDLPEMLVNLNTTGRQASYLKIRIALELDDPEAPKRLDPLLPRVIDNFQVYLRELRMDDLSGSAGIYRLKEELLMRVNAAVRPIHVRDVLFKDMLVQ